MSLLTNDNIILIHITKSVEYNIEEDEYLLHLLKLEKNIRYLG
jgi:hypothetical protein